VITLGLNGFAGADHDASAALVIDQKVAAVVEEERLNRRRHSPGDQPLLAVREVLSITGISAGDIDAVCHGWRPETLGLGLTEKAEAETIRAALAGAGVALRPGTPVTFTEHHLAHFWSGVAFTPPGARSAIDGLILDGAGESTAGAFFRLRGGRLHHDWNLGLSGSLGLLYETASSALGFRPGEEGKTMGLASYGRQETMEKIPAPPDDRFTGPIPALRDRNEIRQKYRAMLRQMRDLVPDGASFNQRADVALGVQQAVEAQIMAFLSEIADPAPALVMAGGVALNCSINATVAHWCDSHGGTLTIPPPAGDGGIAVGAAISVAPDPAACTAESPFLGRDFSQGEIADRLNALGLRVSQQSAIELAAALVERDQLCGWFEGRSEVGPRALGKRSILSRADSGKIRDRLNVIKGRESWRPLAPSVLAPEFEKSFRGIPSPHMLINCTATPAAMTPLSGVIHVDNTARPQVVTGAMAEGPYGQLLTAIGQLTGHTAITCTSFNPGGQPIVYSPDDALAAARQMGLDLLAGDGWCAILR
jgi:carbamoyltransferase